MPHRPKTLLVHPILAPRGGGESVAAWTLQALRGLGEISVLALDEPDFEGLNTRFGTNLHRNDFRIELPRIPLALLERLPTRSAILRDALLMRRCRQLDRLHRYDALLSTHNQLDFGRHGIQYVHAPYGIVPPPAEELRWVHRLPGLLPLYRRLSRRIAGSSDQRTLANLTLVNSEFVAERVRRAWGITSTVVPPPVPGGFPEVPWSEREDAVVCIGRLHPCKRMVEVVDIIEQLRRRGTNLRLTLIAAPEDRDYEARLRKMAAERAWMTMHVALPRSEMVGVVARHCYAIHAMIDEDFGIAVAEALRAGCLPFVHDSGGPREILGGDPRLLFRTDQDAVERIERVYHDDALQAELRTALGARRDLYSEHRFIQSIRSIVERELAVGAGR